MTSLILLTLLRDSQVDAAFARFKAAMQAMPSYEAHFTVGTPKRVGFNAMWIAEDHKRILYDADPVGGHDIVTVGPEGYREVDHRTRTYDESPGPASASQLQSRMSRIVETSPIWLMVGDLHRLVFQGTTPVWAGKETVSGISCDLIRDSFTGRMGRASLELCIAPSGLVYRMYRVQLTPQGEVEMQWIFRDYKPLVSPVPAMFANPIPDGFLPYSLPDHDYPTEVGRKLNLSGWVDSATGAKWKAPASRLLFVLTSRESAPSGRALRALTRWKTELSARHITVAVASDASSADLAGGHLYNPDGRSLLALDAPATPLFVLLDATGTIANLWMGFDPAREAAMHSDLVKAAAALK